METVLTNICRSSISPPQTATPTSMSDIDNSPEPVGTTGTESKRPGPGPAAGLFTEGPNARSKSVTVADGGHTYGVSRTYLSITRFEMRH
jgi:hypothetical protein